ncbi:MAG: PAS domain S-box protein [Myxococcota bacterium]
MKSSSSYEDLARRYRETIGALDGLREANERADCDGTCCLEQVLSTGHAMKCRRGVRIGSGHVRHLDVVVAPMTNDEGQIDRIVEVARDITDLVQVQDRLRETESYLRSLLRASPAGLGVVKDRVFRQVNDRMETMTGYAAHELLGQSTRMLYATQAAFEQTGSTWYGQIREHGSGTVETRWKRKDGRMIDVLVASAPKEPGNAGEIAFAVVDVSRLKQAEAAEREMAERLAALERRAALGVLASGIAHDLNNVLGPMLLLLPLVEDVLSSPAEASEEDFAEARHDLSMVGDAVRRAAAMVHDLKALGRRASLAREPVDVVDLARSCLETQEARALRRAHPEVALELAFGPEPALTRGDRESLHRCLFNLIMNAMQAVEGAGRVLVQVDTTELEARVTGYEVIEPGSYVTLRVSDTGQGVGDAYYERIFEPFVTSKKGRGGTGLGLAVVHAAVKDHGGFIDVERDEGGWSTSFVLYLPWCQR